MNVFGNMGDGLDWLFFVAGGAVGATIGYGVAIVVSEANPITCVLIGGAFGVGVTAAKWFRIV